MHTFNVRQVANGYILTFPSHPHFETRSEDTYVFTDVMDLTARLPAILKRREEAAAPKVVPLI